MSVIHYTFPDKKTMDISDFTVFKWAKKRSRAFDGFMDSCPTSDKFPSNYIHWAKTNEELRDYIDYVARGGKIIKTEYDRVLQNAIRHKFEEHSRGNHRSTIIPGYEHR